MLKSYFGKGKYIVLDSGFCVIKALVKLRKKRCFACALIKKCRIWPTDVPGNKIDSQLTDIEVGETEAIQGSLDGITNNLWMMKESDYIMKMMSTIENLIADRTCHSTTRCWMIDGAEKLKEF